MENNLPQRHKGTKKDFTTLKFLFFKSQFCLVLTAYCLLILSCTKKQEWNFSGVKQLSQYEISDLQRVNDSTIIGVGGDRYNHGEFYVSTDNGITWTEKEILDKELYAVSFLNESKFIACGYDGKLLQSNNAGTDWSITQNERWIAIRNVLWLNDSTIISCGGGGFTNGVITRSTNGGASWKTDSLTSEMRGLCVTDAQTIYCCGYGKIVKSTDAGANWQQQKAEGDFFVSISFSTAEHGVAVGLEGTILITDDGGEHWKKIRNGNSLTNQSWNFRRIIFRDANKGYIIGDNGLFLFTTDGGTTWTKIKNTSDENFLSIVLTDDGGIIGSDEGKLFRVLEN